MATTPLTLELGANSKALETALDRIAKRLEALITQSERLATSLTNAFAGVQGTAARAAQAFEQVGRSVSANISRIEAASRQVQAAAGARAPRGLDPQAEALREAREASRQIQADLARRNAERERAVREAARADAQIARRAAAEAERDQRAALARQETTVRQVTGRFENFFANTLVRTFSLVEQASFRLFNILTGGGFEGAIRTSVEFEKAIADVGSILRGATPPIETYREALLKIAQTTSKDLVDLTRGLYEAISAGADPALKAGGALDILNQSQRAAVAGLADVQSTVKAGTIIFNTFGKNVGSAEQVFNKLFEAVNIGVFTFPELSAAIGKVANIAASSGVALDEMLGAIASISKGGVSASQSVTQLSRLIIAITNPTKEASKFIKQYGVDINATTLRARGLRGIVEELNKVLAAEGEVGIRRVVGGRIEAFRAALSLLREGGSAFLGDVRGVEEGTNALDRALKQQTNTVQEQLGILQNQFRVLAAEVGVAVGPIIVSLLKDLQNQLSGINRTNLIDFFRGAATSVRDFVRDLSSFKETISSVGSLLVSAFTGAALVGGVVALERGVRFVSASFSNLGAVSAAATASIATGAPRAAAAVTAAGTAADGAASKFGALGRLSFGGLIGSIFLVVEAVKLLITLGNAAGEALGRALERRETAGLAESLTTRGSTDITAGLLERQEGEAKALRASIEADAREALRGGKEITAQRRAQIQEDIKVLQEGITKQAEIVAKAAVLSDEDQRAEQEKLDGKRKNLAELQGILEINREVDRADLERIESKIKSNQELIRKELVSVSELREEQVRQADSLRETIATQIGTEGLENIIKLPPDAKRRAQELEKLINPFASPAEKAALIDSVAKLQRLNDIINTISSSIAQLRAKQASISNIGDIFGIALRATKAEAARVGVAKPTPKEPRPPGPRPRREIEVDERALLRAQLDFEQERLRGLRAGFKEEIVNRKEAVDEIEAQIGRVATAERALAAEEIKIGIERARKIAGDSKQTVANRARATEQVAVLEKTASQKDLNIAQESLNEKERLRKAEADKIKRQGQETVQALTETFRRVAEVQRKLAEGETREEAVAQVEPAKPLEGLNKILVGGDEVIAKLEAITKKGTALPATINEILRALDPEQLKAFGPEFERSIAQPFRQAGRTIVEVQKRSFAESFSDTLNRIAAVQGAIQNFVPQAEALRQINPLESLLKLSPETVTDFAAFVEEFRKLTVNFTKLPTPEAAEALTKFFSAGQAGAALPQTAFDIAGKQARPKAPALGDAIVGQAEKLPELANEAAVNLANKSGEAFGRAGKAINASLKKNNLGDVLSGLFSAGADAASGILAAGAAAASALLSAGLNLVIGKVTQVISQIIQLAGEEAAKSGEREREALASIQRERRQLLEDFAAATEDFTRRRSDLEEKATRGAEELARLQAGKPATRTLSIREERDAAIRAKRQELADAARDKKRLETEQQRAQEEQAAQEKRLAEEEEAAKKRLELGPFRFAVEQEILKLGTFIKNLLSNLPNVLTVVLIQAARQLTIELIRGFPALFQEIIRVQIELFPQLAAAFIDILFNYIISGGFIEQIVTAFANGIANAAKNVFDITNPESAFGKIGGAFKDFGSGVEDFFSFHRGGFVPRYQTGGFTKALQGNFANNITARQQQVAQEFFKQIRQGAVPALLERGELIVPQDIAEDVAEARSRGDDFRFFGRNVQRGRGAAEIAREEAASIRRGREALGAADVRLPGVTVNFVSRSGAAALIAKLVSDTFVNQAQREGAVNVRSARDVVSGGKPLNLPRPVRFQKG